MVIAAIFTLLFGLFFFFFKRKKSKVKPLETEEERRKNARKKLAKKLSVAKSYLDGGQVAKFYDEILLGLNKYINEKLSIQTSEMSKKSIRETLHIKGVEEKTISSFVEVLEQCEMAKYAPLTNQNNQVIYEKSLDVIEDIEEKIK